MLPQENDASTRGVKDGDQGKGDDEMQSQAQSRYGDPALESLRAEQTARDEMKKPLTVDPRARVRMIADVISIVPTIKPVIPIARTARIRRS